MRPAQRRKRWEAEAWLADKLVRLPREHAGMARIAAWAGLGGCGCPWTVAEAACRRGSVQRAARGPEW